MLIRSIGTASVTVLLACGPRMKAAPSPNGGADAGEVDAPTALANLSGITVNPPDMTLAVVSGVSPPASVSYTAIGHFPGQADQDITSKVVWTIDNSALGSFSVNVFSASGAAAGVGTVRATNGCISGTAPLTVSLTSTLLASGGSPAVPPNAASLFGGPADSSRAPAIYYPYNQVVMPPNLNQLDVQWDPGSASNTLFKIEFKGPLTDVSIYTRCVTPPSASAGCGYGLDPATWEKVAAGSRGAYVSLSVEGTDDRGSGVGSSVAQSLAFTQDDIQGGVYYWTTSSGSSIMRFDFGSSATAATPYMDPTVASKNCIGCHSISPDGAKVTVAFEPGANVLGLYSVATRSPLAPFPVTQASFVSWAPDGSKFAAVFDDFGSDPNISLYDGVTGAHLSDIDLGGWEASHPSYSPDGSSIAFTHVGVHDLSQVFGEGAIAVVKQTSPGVWGAPVDLVPRQTGINQYYPAYSPDGSLLVFDVSTCGKEVVPCMVSWVSVDCSCDADADPSATLYYLPVTSSPGAAPLMLANANAGHPAADKGEVLLTNSWPKWSPFTSNRTSAGPKIAWLTFSSTRNFGFVQTPPGVDENPRGSYLWMTAVDLSKATEVGAGVDPSSPPFILPFQDLSTSNHMAQWTTKVVALQ